jgi:hypothetical protein
MNATSAGRASLLTLGLGVLFVLVGLRTTPGLGERTAVACQTYGPSAFR